VDRSLGRRGQSLVVAAALLGALIGTGLGAGPKVRQGCGRADAIAPSEPSARPHHVPRAMNPPVTGLATAAQVRTTSADVLPHPSGIQVTPASARKILEPGLVGGPTRCWVAARATSRWVRISGMTSSVGAGACSTWASPPATSPA
jgi:hypothetical protein